MHGQSNIDVLPGGCVREHVYIGCVKMSLGCIMPRLHIQVHVEGC